MTLRLGRPTAQAVALWRAAAADWPQAAARLSPAERARLSEQGFVAKPGAFALVDLDGVRTALVLGDDGDPFDFGRFATALPPGRYRLSDSPTAARDALAFLLSSYRFDRYRAAGAPAPVLEAPPGLDGAEVERIANAVAGARDLINTPANDMGPADLAAHAETLALRYGARCEVTIGPALAQAYPLVEAVGRGAGARAPRVVDFVWDGAPRQANALRVTLVGKGVCFDTGGLDIKPAAGMILMKKDMGGAAAALAAAEMIMDAGAPVRLRVVLPIVENAISSTAFRPSDIYPSRLGLTVEVGDTDAEGRLILADALAAADADAPDLLIDFATLTGAARVALGPDLPPFFTQDEALAAAIAAAGARVADPVWRLPLWAPYAKGLESPIADLVSVAPGGFAGAIIAALFLSRFVSKARAYAHFDIYGWTPKAKPGRPEGGEPQAARLVYDLVKTRAAATSN